MDSFGQTFLELAIVALIAGLAGFWWLARRGLPGVALGVAALLYVLSFVIGDGNDRALHGALGVVRLLGFGGGIIGIVGLVRASRNPPPP